MPRRHVVPPSLRGRPFTAAEARAVGLAPSCLESPLYASPLRGVHHEARLGATAELRARAASLLLPEGGAVSLGWAAQLWGADVLPEAAAVVDVVVPRGARAPRVRGLAARSVDLAPRDVGRVGDVPVTSWERTGVDVLRRLPSVEAVVVVDALAAAAAIDLAAVRDRLEQARGRPGATRGLLLLDLVRHGVESPMETRTRLLLVDAGLPEPEVQVEVVEAGELLGRLDLAYREQKVGVEFDGRVHDRPDVVARDTARVTRLQAAGWVVLRFRAADVYRRPWWVVRQVVEALRLRGLDVRMPTTWPTTWPLDGPPAL